MAMAFSYIAKHRQIFFLCYAFVDKHFSKTCDFFSIFPAKINKHFFLLHKGNKIFGYIFSYIAIAELKAKHFNESHSHL